MNEMSFEYFLNTFQNDDALNLVKSILCESRKDFESLSRYYNNSMESL